MSGDNNTNIFAELKRRKILRAAGVYGVAAFGLTEILTFVLESFNAPLWTSKLVAALFVAGFPIAMFLAWVFDLTPGGHLERTRFTQRSNSQIIGVAIVMLTLATGGLFYLVYPRGESVPVAAETAQPGTLAPAKEVLGNVMAILPFRNLSPEPADAYLSAGMADTLLSKLQVVRGLSVVASSTSSVFGDRKNPIRDLARELGVGKVAHGSVQKVGDQIRVVVELVQSTSGVQLWASVYDGKAPEIFEIQDRLAIDMMRALNVSQEDRPGLTEGYKPALAAYEELVEGRISMGQGTVSGLRQAVSRFEKAAQLDSGYAEAYINLAEAYGLQDTYTYGSSDSYSGIPSLAIRKAQQPLIEKALELDPGSGPALALQAILTPTAKDARAMFEKAIDLAPNAAPVRLNFARFLMLRSGDFEEAEKQISIAAELDPLSPMIQYTYAKAVWGVGRAEKALSMIIDNVRRNPEFPFNYKLMARWQMQLGRMDNALRWIRKAREIDPDSPSHWGEFGGECYVLESIAATEEAQACHAEFAEAHPESIAAQRDGALLNNDFQEYVRIFERAVADEPGNLYRVNQLIWGHQFAGQPNEALKVFAETFPEIFAGREASNALTTWPTIMAAQSACGSGDQSLCGTLVQMAEAGLEDLRLILGGGFLMGTERMQLLAMQGKNEAALAEFRRIVDAGWMFLWNYLPVQPDFAAIRDTEEFQTMLAQIAAEVAAQRDAYYANPDAPLY